MLKDKNRSKKVTCSRFCATSHQLTTEIFYSSSSIMPTHLNKAIVQTATCQQSNVCWIFWGRQIRFQCKKFNTAIRQ